MKKCHFVTRVWKKLPWCWAYEYHSWTNGTISIHHYTCLFGKKVKVFSYEV